MPDTAQELASGGYCCLLTALHLCLVFQSNLPLTWSVVAQPKENLQPLMAGSLHCSSLAIAKQILSLCLPSKGK